MSETENKPVTVGQWIIVLILLGIPLVNIIMLIIWAAGSSAHPSKKTYAQAVLILLGVVVALGVVAGLLLPHAK